MVMTNWIEQGQASLPGHPGPNGTPNEHDTYIIDCRHMLICLAHLSKYPSPVFFHNLLQRKFSFNTLVIIFQDLLCAKKDLRVESFSECSKQGFISFLHTRNHWPRWPPHKQSPVTTDDVSYSWLLYKVPMTTGNFLWYMTSNVQMPMIKPSRTQIYCCQHPTHRYAVMHHVKARGEYSTTLSPLQMQKTKDGINDNLQYIWYVYTLTPSTPN